MTAPYISPARRTRTAAATARQTAPTTPGDDPDNAGDAPPLVQRRWRPLGTPPNFPPQDGDEDEGPDPARTAFSQNLENRWRTYQGPAPFQAPPTTSATAPTFTPGANPFTATQQPQFTNAGVPGAARQVAGPAYQPGTSTANYTAVSGPQLQTTGPFTPGQSGLDPILQRTIATMLGSPSAYTSDAVQQSFNRLSGNIDDDFALQTQALEEDMAQRGLADSSIRGGRLQDLNVARRSARTELADRLVEKQAETQSADLARAIAQGMGYQGQQFNQGLAGFNANLAASGQNFNQDLATRAFQGDQQAMEVLRNLDIGRFNRESGQQGFENTVSLAQANEGLDVSNQQRLLAALGFNNTNSQQGFENLMGAAGFNRQLGLDRFTNDLARADYLNAEDQRGISNAANQYGLNLTGNQQGFNQSQALLQNLLGYEQQGFENRFNTQQFDADNQFRNYALELQAYLSSLGIGSPGQGPNGGPFDPVGMGLQRLPDGSWINPATGEMFTSSGRPARGRFGQGGY